MGRKIYVESPKLCNLKNYKIHFVNDIKRYKQMDKFAWL